MLWEGMKQNTGGVGNACFFLQTLDVIRAHVIETNWNSIWQFKIVHLAEQIRECSPATNRTSMNQLFWMCKCNLALWQLWVLFLGEGFSG